jgi:4-hydroxy-L-threonine phosphate dehydrogenase PdxA
MKELGIENPRIGVAGLNPHSGEDGLLVMRRRERFFLLWRRRREKGFRRK